MEGITAELLNTWGYGKIDTCNLQIDFITTLPAKATTADFITTLPAFLKAFQISGYEPPSGNYGGSNNKDSFTSALIPIISKDIAVIKASDQMGNGKIGGIENKEREDKDFIHADASTAIEEQRQRRRTKPWRDLQRLAEQASSSFHFWMWFWLHFLHRSLSFHFLFDEEDLLFSLLVFRIWKLWHESCLFVLVFPSLYDLVCIDHSS